METGLTRWGWWVWLWIGSGGRTDIKNCREEEVARSRGEGTQCIYILYALLKQNMVHVNACTEQGKSMRVAVERDLKQDSPGGVGGCGCGSVEEGELCKLTCGTAAVEEGGA